jgi:molecular chaperone GrpE
MFVWRITMSDKKHKEENSTAASEKQTGHEAEPSKPAADDKQAVIDDLTNTLKHLQAEFENYKKRSERENESYSKFANEHLIKEILPVIDHFELALKNTKQKDEFYKGMELVYAQLVGVLNDNGLKCIGCDCKFDPYYHEVLLTEESEKDNNLILEELQKGYTLNDRVIRHSKVKIAKKRKKEEKSESTSPAGV